MDRAPGMCALANGSLPRVEQNEIERVPLPRLQHVVALLHGAELVDQVFAIGANVLGCKRRCLLLLRLAIP